MTPGCIIVSNQNIIFDIIQPTFLIERKLQLVNVTRILKVYFDVIYFASKNCERHDDEHRKGNTINCLFRFLLAFLWDHIHITVQKLQAFYFQTVPQYNNLKVTKIVQQQISEPFFKSSQSLGSNFLQQNNFDF